MEADSGWRRQCLGYGEEAQTGGQRRPPLLEASRGLEGREGGDVVEADEGGVIVGHAVKGTPSAEDGRPTSRRYGGCVVIRLVRAQPSLSFSRGSLSLSKVGTGGEGTTR